MSKLNDFDKELIGFFGEEKFQIIANTKIGIAGCGGLGSNCAAFLVRSGFRKIKVVDFDEVEYSNLNRQFYFYDQKGQGKAGALKDNLKKINPSTSVEFLTERIEKDNVEKIFLDCSIVVEAFDKAEYKSLIVSSLIAEKELIVSASGLCGVGSSDEIVTRRIKNNLVVVGDFVTDVESAPPFAPRVAIAAAKQADIILEYVLGKK